MLRVRISIKWSKNTMQIKYVPASKQITSTRFTEQQSEINIKNITNSSSN